jgi:hypothetical protein
MEKPSLTDSCCCPAEAGQAVCEIPAQSFQRTHRAAIACPVCGAQGKPVHGHTVKALLLVSLREVQDVEYLFCKTQTCPVVYFSSGGEQTFTVEQVLERVYQKEPESGDVFICYCFRHTVEDLRKGSPESRKAIVDDINMGINAGQCACDLRNPQGSCCLGNVRDLIKNVDPLDVAIR